MKYNLKVNTLGYDPMENKVGDLIYEGHRLMKVRSIRKNKKTGVISIKFRVIGRVNLDKQLQPAE